MLLFWGVHVFPQISLGALALWLKIYDFQPLSSRINNIIVNVSEFIHIFDLTHYRSPKVTSVPARRVCTCGQSLSTCSNRSTGPKVQGNMIR